MPSPHGTRSRYTQGCRCDDCRESKRLYYHEYKWRKARERWGVEEPSLVDAEPSRQHVQYLMAHGMGQRRIAELSGLGITVIQRLMGWCKSRPAHRVYRDTEAKLLAVQPNIDTLAGRARVPAGPTARRVQALVAIGWPMRQLASRLGITQQNFHLHKLDDSHTVYAATARNVAALYEELSMTVPPAGQPATRAKNHAQRKGWPPPLAWDDIDTGELADGWDDFRRDWRVDAGECATCADIEHLRFMGDTDNAVIAGRLGISTDSLHKHLTRHGRIEMWSVA